MRQYLLITLLLLPAATFAQIGLKATQIIVVHNQLTYGVSRPMCGINADGNAVVVWGKRNNQHVYASLSSGNVFGTPVRLNPQGMTVFAQDWAGPEMSIAGNKVAVVFKSQPEASGFVYLVTSSDGGKSFGDTIRVSNKNWSRFPSVALSPDGKNVYVAYMSFEENFKEPHYVVCTSKDGGKTFSGEVKVSLSPGEVCDCCPASITANGSLIMVSYRNNDENLRDNWVAISSDQGASFGLVGDVDNTDWTAHACPASGPEGLIGTDSIYSTWMSSLTGTGKVYFSASTSQNLKSSPSFKLTPQAGKEVSQNFPKIAGKSNKIAVVWEEYEEGVGSIKAVYSSTGGPGLQSAMFSRIDDEIGGVPQNPRLFYDGTSFYACWQNNAKQTIYFTKLEVSSLGVLDETEQHFQFYPNPANNQLNLSGDVERYEIRNVAGNEVMSGKIHGSGQASIDVRSLSQGVYLIRVFNDFGTAAKYFQVIH